MSPIENGVPIPKQTSRAKSNFALGLGRICPEKGFHLAMEASKQAGVPFFLGGKVYHYPSHLEYFRREIVPRADHQRRFLGPLGSKRKNHYLAGARCLLVPSLVPETSSLAAMEALACGTPVIAFPSGALPEIVTHGKTGFLVNCVDQMAEAIRLAPEISAETCRTAARERYSLRAMTARYLQRYHELVRDANPADAFTERHLAAA